MEPCAAGSNKIGRRHVQTINIILIHIAYDNNMCPRCIYTGAIQCGCGFKSALADGRGVDFFYTEDVFRTNLRFRKKKPSKHTLYITIVYYNIPSPRGSSCFRRLLVHHRFSFPPPFTRRHSICVCRD